MAMSRPNYDMNYGLIIFALAAVAWGVGHLLALNTILAYWFAGILILLVSMTCIGGVVHYWRYGMHK